MCYVYGISAMRRRDSYILLAVVAPLCSSIRLIAVVRILRLPLGLFASNRERPFDSFFETFHTLVSLLLCVCQNSVQLAWS